MGRIARSCFLSKSICGRFQRAVRCTLDITPEQLGNITLELLRREGWRENVYIRPLAYKDDDIFKIWLHEAKDKAAMFSQRVGRYIESDAGAKVQGQRTHWDSGEE